MLSIHSLLTFLVAGTALAVTPPGFEPSSNQDLELAFCDNLAVNGANIPQEETEMSPAVGTKSQLTGTFTVIMVDTDVPASTPGGETGSFLHLIQTGLTSANVTALIAGEDMFELENTYDIEPLAAFVQPNPPNQSPTTHRYTTLLLNNTDNDKAMAVLRTASKTRLGFNVADMVAQSGADVVAATFFTVTNTSAAAEKVEVRELTGDMEAERKPRLRRYPMAITTIQNQPSPGAPAGSAQTITINPNQAAAPGAGTNSTIGVEPGQAAAPGAGANNPIIIVVPNQPNQPDQPGQPGQPGQPAAPGAGGNNPIIVVVPNKPGQPGQPAAPVAGSTQTITFISNQPTAPATTAAPASGLPPRFTLNTTQPATQPGTQPAQAQQGPQVIVIRLSQIQGQDGLRNVSSITSFTTPKVPGEAPQTTAPTNPSQGAPGQAGAPFQNGTQPTSSPVAGVDAGLDSGVGAGQPATTGTGVLPPPTGGAGSLMGSGNMHITFAIVGLSIMAATFVSF